MSRHDTGLSGAGDWLMKAAQRNPEGLLLLAAGAALLMRSSATFLGSDSRPNRHKRRQQGRPGGQHVTQEHDAGWTDGVTRAAETARDYASDVTGRVTETASSYASAVGDYASETGRAVSQQSARYARQAQSTVSDTVSHVVQEQPLALVLAGLAAGAAVAAAFPPTDIERRTLGQAGEKLTGYASQARDQLRDATYAAGERLVSSVEERGLSTDSLKDVARDVAGSFSDGFSGESSDKPASSPRPQSGKPANGKPSRSGPSA
jgi:hypothetical protein